MYGVGHYLPKKAGWKSIDAPSNADPRVLERVVYYTTIRRTSKNCSIYLIADAWDGAHIQDAMTAYFTMAAGALEEQVPIKNGDREVSLQAGGAAHLVVFVGHNGLMDFSLAPPANSFPGLPPRSAAALSCTSKPYFSERLVAVGAHPLLLTTGLMAPEAYTLDAVVRTWASGKDTTAVVESAAQVYNQYQKCGIKGARRLFWGDSD